MKILITFLLGIVCSYVNGQNFFIEKQKSELSLSSSETLIYDNLESIDHVKSVKSVNLGLVTDYIQNNKFICHLPIYDDVVTFDLTTIEIIDNNSFIIIGTSDPCDQVGGSFLISSTNSFEYGYFKVDEREFELHALNSNDNLLLEIDPLKVDGDCGVGNEVTSINKEEQEENIEVRTPIDYVKLLVLYNESAEDYANIFEKVSYEVGLANTVLSNSEIEGVYIEFVIEPYLTYTPTMSGFDEVNALAESDQYVDNKREEHSADIVAVLVGEKIYDSNGNREYGHVSNACDFGNSELCYVALVDIKSPKSRMTFPHEIFHLFGGRHAFTSPCAPSYASAHTWFGGFWNLYKRSSIMVVGSEAKSRIGYISNPNVNYDGDATGVIDQSENYLQINDYKNALSLYRNGISEGYFDSKIVGPTSGSNNNFYLLSADTQGCTNTTYEWFEIIGNNGQTSPLLSTNYQLEVELDGNSHFYAKLIAICEGSEVVDFHKITNTDYDPCGPNSGLISSDNISISPSPAKDIIFMQFKDSYNEFFISDSGGNLIYKSKISNKNSMSLNVSNYNPGIYIISFISEEKNTISYKKLVIVD